MHSFRLHIRNANSHYILTASDASYYWPCRKSNDVGIFNLHVLSSNRYLSRLNVQCIFPAVYEGLVKGKAVQLSSDRVLEMFCARLLNNTCVNVSCRRMTLGVPSSRASTTTQLQSAYPNSWVQHNEMLRSTKLWIIVFPKEKSLMGSIPSLDFCLN